MFGLGGRLERLWRTVRWWIVDWVVRIIDRLNPWRRDSPDTGAYQSQFRVVVVIQSASPAKPETPCSHPFR